MVFEVAYKNHCMLTDETLRHIFSGFQDGDSAKDAYNCREVLRTFGQKVYKNQDEINIDAICSDHSRQFCNLFRMFTNISHKERADRLDKLYRGLDSWKDTWAQYSTWFRQQKPNGTHITTNISHSEKNASVRCLKTGAVSNTLRSRAFIGDVLAKTRHRIREIFPCR